MALTSAYFTALTGLNTNSRNMDIIGNNIANVNTAGYKSSRAVFSTMFASTLRAGSPPTTDSGGANPIQVGHGARISGIQKNFSNGSIQTTGINTNLALEGTGYFVVEEQGSLSFTRSGAFTLNRDNQLVDMMGGYVQGFPVDDQFEVVTGNMERLTIPLGTETIADPTRHVNFSGNLNASGALPSVNGVHASRTYFTDAALTLGNEADGTLDLTVNGNNLWMSNGAGGSFLAIEGGTDTKITLSTIEKAGKDLGEHTFAFASAASAATMDVDDFGSTLNDFTTFLDQILGLDNTVINGNDLGGGVAITNGQLVVTANEGRVQDIAIDTADMVSQQINPGGGSEAAASVAQPFIMERNETSDGESVRTSFAVYDSLGTPITIELTYTLQEIPGDGGTIWNFIAESNGNANLDRVLGMGSVKFDSNGNYLNASNRSFSIERANGAVTPLTVEMVFSSETNAISSLTSTSSSLAAVSQDGSPVGTLENFTIVDDGRVIGAFSNGLTRTLGQIALATFSNPEGLVEHAGGRFAAGPNSGDPIISTPGQFGSAKVLAGSIELSNVDLAAEFVDLITTSTGFSANSRVITTTDQLMQELLTLVR